MEASPTLITPYSLPPSLSYSIFLSYLSPCFVHVSATFKLLQYSSSHVILTDTWVPPLQLFLQSKSLGTHHSLKSSALSPLIYLLTGTMPGRPAEFAIFYNKFEEQCPLSAVRSYFCKTEDQPRHREITCTSSPSASSGIFRKGDCCHAITREAGKDCPRAITRVTGEDSGFTLLRRAKSLSKPYLLSNHALNT